MQRMNVMIRLSRRSERGAVASIVAMLLGFGVVLGFAAVSIDVGSLMWERRQVQNGADAAALSMAKTCAVDPGSCVAGGGDQPLLDTLNNNNAKDLAGGFDSSSYPSGLCGRANSLPGCAGSTGALADCPQLPASVAANASVPYVEAHTQTKAVNGTSILPTWLVRTLAGGSTGETVRACARAAYGSPGPTAASAPITFSMCEWRQNTNSGNDYYQYDPTSVPGGYFVRPGNPPSQPPWPLAATTPATPGQEIIITLQGGPHSPLPCPNWQGHDVAGGFGYIEASGCASTIGQDSWIKIDTGNSTACDLSQYWKRVVYLPVFDCVMRSLTAPSGAPPTSPADVCNYGTGNNTYYHIAGWAKFYLSGYRVGGSDEKASPASGSVPCSGGDRCISGWFLEGVLRDAPVAGPPPPPGSPGFGTYAIQPAG